RLAAGSASRPRPAAALTGASAPRITNGSAPSSGRRSGRRARRSRPRTTIIRNISTAPKGASPASWASPIGADPPTPRAWLGASPQEKTMDDDEAQELRSTLALRPTQPDTPAQPAGVLLCAAGGPMLRGGVSANHRTQGRLTHDGTETAHHRDRARLDPMHRGSGPRAGAGPA